MEEKIKLKLLKLIKEKNYVERYKYVFNSNIDIKKLLMLNEEEVNTIVNKCYTDSSRLIKMYEIFNNINIDKNICTHLFNVNDEVLRYSVNIINSNIISEKEEYVKAFIIGESSSLKYADYLVKREDIINHEYGFNIVNNVLKNEKNIAIYFRDIFTIEELLNNSKFKEIFDIIINIKNTIKLDYIYKLLSNENIINDVKLIDYIKLISNASDDIEIRNIYLSIMYKNSNYIEENEESNNKILDAIKNRDVEEVKKYLLLKIKQKK